MVTDYHCHVLPEMDDGAKNVDISIQMLQLLKKQGVDRVVATPHFYAHREKSVEDFLKRRQYAKQKVLEEVKKQNIDVPEIILGAEVAIEQGICSYPGIEKLTMEGTNQILLEFPYCNFAPWMLEEIYNVCSSFHLLPIIAHVHRCMENSSKRELDQILQMDAVFQINNEAFDRRKTKTFVKKLVKQGKQLIYGSDAHNMGERKPNFR